MGKSVFGRLMVDFRSIGTRINSPQIVDFFHYREQAKERPLAALESSGHRPKGTPNALRKRRAKVYNFLRITFVRAGHLIGEDQESASRETSCGRLDFY